MYSIEIIEKRLKSPISLKKNLRVYTKMHIQKVHLCINFGEVWMSLDLISIFELHSVLYKIKPLKKIFSMAKAN